MNEKDFPYTRKEVQAAGDLLVVLCNKLEADPSSLFSEAQRTMMTKVAIDLIRKGHKSYRWDNEPCKT